MPTKKVTATSKPAAKKAPKAKPAAPPKKMSALDAAAQVLNDCGGAMTTTELIEAMAAQKLWESPNGKTPAATLYSAILREVTTKGGASRFTKTAPGAFAATGAVAHAEGAGKARVSVPKATQSKAAKGSKKPAAKNTTQLPATEEVAPEAAGPEAVPAA